MRVVLLFLIGAGATLACALLAGVTSARPGGQEVRKEEAGKPWALQTPRRPPVPPVQHADWPRNPIDRFLLAEMEGAGLHPSPEAGRAVLVRRVTFDLTGLPPTPEEVQAALSDPSPDWYEKVVDRLLASPAYGERWATFWLDLARYAETDGFKADDRRPQAWRYRDYVIRSLNADKPYDRFIKEQLAGDELFPNDPDALIATGFNRHYPDEYNAVNLEQRRQEILNDMTDTVGQAFLGLTVGCARCHDHKFDPITQEDYYRVQAFFAAFLPAEVPVGPREELERYRRRLAEWQAKTAGLRKEMAELEGPIRQRFTERRKARFPKEYQEMYDLPPEKRSPLQQQIALMVAKQVEVSGEEAAKSMKPEARKKWQELNKQMAERARLKPPAPPTAMALREVGPVAPPTYLLKRGDWRTPGKEVAPGFLSVLDNRTVTVPAPRPDAPTTGRRRILAEWLTRPDNPLTARVMVNRLWQHHFGRGIVATPSDFGTQGDPPTHPELLDWLACAFMGEPGAKGELGALAPGAAWRLKHLHRLMVTSATYRQSSGPNPSAAAVDPENKLLWRMNRRRLEGEALRDALLSASGLLNPKASGPGIYPELPAELNVKGWAVSPDLRDRNRRSVYVFAKRNLRYPLFGTFDAPDGNEPCARRNQTTTAPQALMLLNGKLTLDLARAFAGRVLRQSGDDTGQVIERAVRLALGRPPDAEERRTLRAFLDRQTAQLRPRLGSKNAPPGPVGAPSDVDAAFGAAVVDLCHALLNLNEFLYVD